MKNVRFGVISVLLMLAGLAAVLVPVTSFAGEKSLKVRQVWFTPGLREAPAGKPYSVDLAMESEDYKEKTVLSLISRSEFTNDLPSGFRMSGKISLRVEKFWEDSQGKLLCNFVKDEAEENLIRAEIARNQTSSSWVRIGSCAFSESVDPEFVKNIEITVDGKVTYEPGRAGERIYLGYLRFTMTENDPNRAGRMMVTILGEAGPIEMGSFIRGGVPR